MSKETKIFQRIKYMDNVVQNMRSIKQFLKSDVSDDEMKKAIDSFNSVLEISIKDVLDFAKKKGVYVREDRASAASEIFRRMFGFWIDDANRLTSKNYSRRSFGRQIAEGLYSLKHWKHISNPTKAGVVKCPDRTFMELGNYPTITRFSSGDFKIQADKELLDLLAEIQEFYEFLENWMNKNE